MVEKQASRVSEVPTYALDEDGTPQDIAQIRAILGKRVYFGATWVLLACLGLIIWRGFSMGWDATNTVLCFAFLIQILTAALFGTRWPIWIHTTIFLFVFSTLIFIGIYRHGVHGVAFGVPVIVALHLCLLHGRRSALLALPVIALLELILAAIWLGGLRGPGLGAEDINLQPAHWAIAIVASVATSAVVIFSSDFIVKRLLDSLTRTKAQARQIAEKESRFRELLEFTPIPIGVVDSDGDIIFLNRNFEKTFGYRQEELKNLRQWFSLAYPDPAYREAVATDWYQRVDEATASGAGNIPAKEIRISCADGTVREVIVTGKVQGKDVIALFQDVTETNKVRRDLEGARQELMAAIEQSPAGILIADAPDVRIRVANSAALCLRGESN